jgi:CRP-like cAMP-binding protein
MDMKQTINLVNLFKNSTNLIEVDQGSTIFYKGEPGDSMYIIIDGEVEIKVSESYAEIVTAGEIIGEMALIDDHARSATATAITHCKLVPVDEQQFQFLVQETPFFALHVMRELVARLRRIDERM